MIVMAKNGAKVLHSKCVEMAKKYGVPIIVKSSFQDDSLGTIVTDEIYLKKSFAKYPSYYMADQIN